MTGRETVESIGDRVSRRRGALRNRLRSAVTKAFAPQGHGFSRWLGMALAAACHFNRMTSKHQNGNKALFGAAFASREIDDQC